MVIDDFLSNRKSLTVIMLASSSNFLCSLAPLLLICGELYYRRYELFCVGLFHQIPFRKKYLTRLVSTTSFQNHTQLSV